jgi:hypothetical protein
MATPIENLLTRRAAVCEELAAIITPTARLAAGTWQAGGLPNASGNVDPVGYKDGLYRELREIDALIQSIDGAFEVTSEAVA